MLEVDWMYFKSDFMNDMYAEVIDKGFRFPFCPLCSLWYMQLTYEIATRYDLPLIVGGWTMGQMTSWLNSGSVMDETTKDAEFALLTEDLPLFIEMVQKKYAKYDQFPKSMKELRKKYKIVKKAVILSPHWFLKMDPLEYTDLIQRKLSWRSIDFSYPKMSTNCSLSYVGSYLSMEKYGYTHFHVEMSKLIRSGKLSRAEAVKALEANFDKKEMNFLLAGLGVEI